MGDHYSFTRLQTFMWCPLFYHKRYVQKLPQESTYPLQVGTAFHAAIANYNAHLVSTGQQTDVSVIADMFKKAVSEDDMVMGTEAYQDAWRIYQHFASDYLMERPDVVAGVEDRLEVEIQGKKLVGVIDRWDYDAEANIASVYDYKTDRRVQTDIEVENDVQMKMYSLLLMSIYPQIETVECHKVFSRYATERTLEVYPSQVEAIEEMAMYYIHKLENEKEWVPTPGQPQCSYCPYVTTCPAIATDNARCQTIEDAQTIGGRIIVLEEAKKRYTNQVKQFVNMNGPVICNGVTYDYHLVEREAVDPQRFAAACESVGVSPLEWMSLSGYKKRTKAFSKLRDQLGAMYDDAVTLKKSTRFGYTKGEDDEEEAEE